MKKIVIFYLACFICILVVSWRSANGDSQSYRCLVQLTNYGGEGAYVVAALINEEGAYEQTLHVSGDDADWYPDLHKWYAFAEEAEDDIDAISGASIQTGGRKIFVLDVPTDKLDAGYTLRFESAVEDGAYYDQDVEIGLSAELSSHTFEGSGYIRFIKLIKQ